MQCHFYMWSSSFSSFLQSKIQSHHSWLRFFLKNAQPVFQISFLCAHTGIPSSPPEIHSTSRVTATAASNGKWQCLIEATTKLKSWGSKVKNLFMQSIVHWRLVPWLSSTPYYQVLFGRCTNSLSKKTCIHIQITLLEIYARLQKFKIRFKTCALLAIFEFISATTEDKRVVFQKQEFGMMKIKLMIHREIV